MTQEQIRSITDTKVNKIGGWLPDANRRGLERLIQKHEVKTALEIGSFLGLSAAFIAVRIEHLHCIDPWEEKATKEDSNNLVWVIRNYKIPNPFWDVFKHNMIEVGVWHNITPHRGYSREFGDVIPEVDLVYVDGDHSYEGCKTDLELYLPKAKKVICGDDIHNNLATGQAYFPGVQRAVRELVPGYQVDDTFWWWEK